MILRNKISFYVFTILFGVITFSCMEDLNQPVEVGFNNSADLLTYFETHGDFINSSENPAIITSEELYGIVDQSLLLDIRSSSEYAAGHIEGAINLNISKLVDSLLAKDLNKYSKIVVISSTGQKAAYAVSLLRLYGFTNIFSLDYGMGQWNELFANAWLNARNDSEYAWSFTTYQYSKRALKNELPSLNIDEAGLSIEQVIKNRIRSFLTDAAYNRSIGTVDELDADFQLRYQQFANIYLICYSTPDLYNISRFFKEAQPPVTWGGHFRSIPYYNPLFDFKASTNLLTLPTNKPIYIYSYNGQRSQFITAYLRLLGYNARSVLYGAVGMLYYRLDYQRFDRSFKEENILNYPIVN